MADFQQQNTQATVDKQYHMNSQNEWWMIQLKAIQVEYYYYSIENQKI